MTAFRRISHLFLFATAVIFATPNSHAQTLISSEEIDVIPAFLITILFNLPSQYDVQSYKLVYNTVDTQGEPTVASGMIAIPISTTCDIFPMAMYCHGTVLRQLDVPSENNFEALAAKGFASTGFITVAPDYLGLGVNAGNHPYVHAESQATASIDLVYAAREFLETLDNMQDNGELFITGYSQGGHAAMATLKYAQDNALIDTLGIVAGAPCSGPYNLSGSQADVLLSGEPYSNPGYVVYLLIGYQLVYGNIYEDLSDIIQSPYDTLVLPFFDGAQNEFNMDTVNAILPGELDSLLVDSVLTNLETNDNHPIWQALRDNDNYDWTPVMPLRLFYCDGDEQVPFTNSTSTDSIMQANGAADVQAIHALPGATHGGCILPALQGANAFFISLASPCGLVSSVQDAVEIKPLMISPNPAKDFIQITVAEAGANITVYNVSGKKVYQKQSNQSTMQIDISALASGLYVVLVQGETVYGGKLIVQ